MIDSWRFNRIKLHIFSTISFVLIIFVILFTDSFISNLSLQLIASNKSRNSAPPKLHTHKVQRKLESKLTQETLVMVQVDVIREEEDREEHGNLLPALEISAQDRVAWFKKKLPEFEIFKTTRLARQFDVRVRKFIGNNCKVQFFNTWISPAGNFGEREVLATETIFKAHPDGCLVIVSRTMDSMRGQKILKPLTDRGYRILAVTPDLSFLFSNTPAKDWFNDLKSGNKDPGRVPLAQNLSNLIRLAVLYKYGGVYLDTDFIVLKDFSGLKNSIGAQAVDVNRNWKILNNAVLVFDKNHPLLYKFIEEYASTFDGNRWGHNGPYLVTRVLQRATLAREFNYTVLPPIAFYPVDWIKIAGFFTRPNGTEHSKWVKAKLIQLRTHSYGVHLWNRETRRLNIQEGSIIGRLISNHCVICRNLYTS